MLNSELYDSEDGPRYSSVIAGVSLTVFSCSTSALSYDRTRFITHCGGAWAFKVACLTLHCSAGRTQATMGAPGAALRSPWTLALLLSAACSLAVGQPFPNLNANAKLTTDVTALAQDGQNITVWHAVAARRGEPSVAVCKHTSEYAPT